MHRGRGRRAGPRRGPCAFPSEGGRHLEHPVAKDARHADAVKGSHGCLGCVWVGVGDKPKALLHAGPIPSAWRGADDLQQQTT
jgi:hypothetical protein